MRFNFNSFSKFLILNILCISSISCSLMLNGTGNVQFKLPVIQDNNNEGLTRISENNYVDFDIVLKTSNGKIAYNESHGAGEVVVIDNLPLGKYELTLEAVTHSSIVKGRENVYVKSGNGSNVTVNLTKSIIGYFVGNITMDKIHKDSFVMYVEIYDTKNGNKLITKTSVNKNGFFKTESLPMGIYKVRFIGKDDFATYNLEMPPIYNMKPGLNTLAVDMIPRFPNEVN